MHREKRKEGDELDNKAANVQVLRFLNKKSPQQLDRHTACHTDWTVPIRQQR
jgi:hypothetical protein